MASSNVDYYQRQKDLQDSIMESEQRRKTLEAQLQAYCRSDQKMAKLRAVKLQSYWKRICEDEKRSKQRNSQLLRDLDRIDANMASLEARREKLKYMKQQYFDQIERAYPKWMDLVMQKRQEQNQHHQQQQHQQQQQQQPQMSQHLQQQQNSPAYQQSPQQSYQQQQQEQQQYQQQQQEQHQYQQQQYQQQQYQQQLHQQQEQQYQQQQQSLHHQQERQQNLPPQSNMYGAGISDDEDEDEVAPPLPSHPPPSAFSGSSNNTMPEREYTNLKDVQRPAQSVPTSPPLVPSVTVHMPKVGGDSASPMKPSGEGGAAGGGDKDVSFSFSEEVHIQPIQSVTVRQKNEAARAVVPTMTAGSDDDVSDLEEDPSAAGIKHEQRSTSPPITPSPPTHRDEEEEEDLAPSVVHPEITTSGIVRLLKYVEEELGNALSVESYYRSRNPDPATRKEIIFKANGSSGLGNVDAELVSMVILEQLTPLIRRLPGACLLSDTILQGNIASLTESHIRDNLHRDSLPLWDKLMEHFVCLVKNNVLGTRELAFVFIPCLVHDNSVMQDKAVHVLDQMVERLVLRGQGAMSPVHDSLDTARSSQQGTVPRLKFGSLVDSRQFTDEESSMITQSMNTETNNKVPLNETDAYKNLISGNQSAQKSGMAPAQPDDDTDNSDNDLEKQFVSTLSPRSHASTIKSVLGSTGGSSQQRKLAGMINSDLDSEPDMDLGHIGDKKEEEDDDFFEFYG